MLNKLNILINYEGIILLFLLLLFDRLLETYIKLNFVLAVTRDGPPGGELSKQFFKEEYLLNYEIGKY